MIHICFGLHDADGRYSKFIGTTMVSIFENTITPPPISPSVAVHILHDATLTDDNREKFSQTAEKYNQSVEFHNVEKLCPDEINFLREKLADKINSRFSIGMFYRLLMKKIFGCGKIIYLDADIIVNLDIEELWQKDLQDHPVAAVPEIEAALNKMIVDKFVLHTGIVKTDNYFCSGVMIFDLDKFDEKFFRNGVQFLIGNPKCESPDQDILNVFFSENYLKLPQKFDSFANCDRYWKLPVAKKIYHYAGNNIGLNLKDEYNRLWLENFSRTPWFNFEVIGRLGERFYMENDFDTLQTQLLIRICIEHQRGFFLSPADVEKAKFIFSIQDDEPIVEIRDSNSLTELFKKMSELHGQKVFFLFYQNYSLLRKTLNAHGFKEFEDFVDGRTFMTREQGGKWIPEYNFIRSL